MLKFRRLSFITCCIVFFISCKKDTKIEPPVTSAPTVKTASVIFDFKAIMNGQPLNNTDWYIDANNDTLKVSVFNYYISNIKLKRNDSLVFAEAESYHLNKHLDGKETFTISHVPEGTYASIEFLIGIDSTRNASGVQKGDLDLNQGMYWDWTTGYLFFKLEGTYKKTATAEIKPYGMHVGTIECLKKCSFKLDGKLVAKSASPSTVFFHTRVDEIFKNPAVIDLNFFDAVSGGRPAKALAENYPDMFEIYNFQN